MYDLQYKNLLLSIIRHAPHNRLRYCTWHNWENPELVKIERIDTEESEEARHYLKQILRSYVAKTQSPRAKKILENYLGELRFFWLVTPKDMKAPLNPFEGN